MRPASEPRIKVESAGMAIGTCTHGASGMIYADRSRSQTWPGLRGAGHPDRHSSGESSNTEPCDVASQRRMDSAQHRPSDELTWSELDHLRDALCASELYAISSRLMCGHGRYIATARHHRRP